MNNNDEELLKGIPLRAPSHELDMRIERLLATECARRPKILRRTVPFWQLLAACVVCTVGAFLAGMLLNGKKAQGPVSGEVRYVIQVDQQGFDVFDWTKYPKKSAPTSRLKAEQTTREAEQSTPTDTSI